MPPLLIAGYAANFQFWVDEVAHCLAAIDSYEDRFDRMCSAERASAETKSGHAPSTPFITPRPISRAGRIPDPLRRHVRSEVCRCFYRFACDCYRHGYLPAETVLGACDRLGIEVQQHDIPATDTL